MKFEYQKRVLIQNLKPISTDNKVECSVSKQPAERKPRSADGISEALIKTNSAMSRVTERGNSNERLYPGRHALVPSKVVQFVTRWHHLYSHMMLRCRSFFSLLGLFSSPNVKLWPLIPFGLTFRSNHHPGLKN